MSEPVIQYVARPHLRFETTIGGFLAVETLSPEVAALLARRERAQAAEIARLRERLGETEPRVVVPIRRREGL